MGIGAVQEGNAGTVELRNGAKGLETAVVNAMAALASLGRMDCEVGITGGRDALTPGTLVLTSSAKRTFFSRQPCPVEAEAAAAPMPRTLATVTGVALVFGGLSALGVFSVP